MAERLGRRRSAPVSAALRGLLCAGWIVGAGPSVAGEPHETVFLKPGQALPLPAAPTGGTVLAALDGGLVSEVSGALPAPLAGDHWLLAVVRDASGGASSPRWLRVRVDGEAPRLELEVDPVAAPVGPSGKLWASRGARVVASAVDAGSGLASGALRVGDSEIAIPPSGKVSLALPDELAEEVAVRIVAEDRAGNRSERSAPLAVDDTPPRGELWVTGPRRVVGQRLVASPAATVTARWVDEGCGLARQVPYLDGATGPPEIWQGPWAPGVHVAEADGFDCAGNRTHIGPLEFEIDHDPPRIEWQRLDQGVSGGSAGDSYVKNPFRIRARAYDTLAGLARFQWSCGGRWETAGREVEQLGLEIVCSDGDVLLRAEDRVGNRRDVTAFVKVDGEPPIVRVVPPSTEVPVAPGQSVSLTAGEELVVTADDSGVGIGEVWYTVDGGAARRLEGKVPFPVAGRFLLEVRAVDRLGNEVRASFKVSVEDPKR